MWARGIWHPILLILLQTLLASCLKKNSLTFVIDDTISMQPIIDQVKDASIKIMDLILKVKSSQIEDVVVVTFNDPDTKLWTKSRNRNNVTEALSSIYAHTDKSSNPCPEYAMSGVYLGLNNSLSRSSLFVFTDSDAEDKHLDSSVIDLCQKTQSMVNFIITTSYCVRDPDTELEVYYKVAKACSGKVIYLNPEEISQVFNWVDIFVQGEMSTFRTIDLPGNRFVSTELFTINEQVEYVLITATGFSANLNIHHNEQLVRGKRVIWLENTKIIQLNNPEVGNYLVEISNHGRITIEIAGRTDFTFEHGFSQQLPKTMNETTAQPIGDTNNYLSILVSDPSKAVTIKDVEILSLEDASIKTIPLINKGENFYTTAPFMSPSHKFKISVNGVVKSSGRFISRMAKVPVQPQPKPKVIPNKKPEIAISEGNTLETKYGESVTLTCKVSAYPPPTIFWKDSRGKIISKTFSLLLQPYDYVSYLTLKNVKNSEEIACYAENELLTTKKTINIKVKYFEVKNQLPAITEAKYGTEKTIKCDIQSPVRIQIRWYLQKDNSSSKVMLITTGSYKVSAEGRELTIVYTDVDKAGKYICEATLDGNEFEKETLYTELKVVGLEVPVIEKRRRLVNVFVNTSATIDCKVTKGTPKPKVTWQWKPNNSEWVHLSYIGEQLHIPNVDLTLAGVYKCVAENREGIDQFNTRLVVNSRPFIKSDKSSYEVTVGAPYVKIICNVTGYPAPTITWHQGENLITNGGNYSIYDGGLLIRNPQENESLNFTCGASNKHGHDLKEFTLTVYQAPKIDKRLKTVKTFVNKSVTINCKVTNGTPKPRVTWQLRPKNSVWLPLSEIGDNLHLDTVSLSQAGDYKCIAENKLGIDQSEITLVVESPPIIISNETEYLGVIGDPFLRIGCKVIGYPTPVINWRQENRTIIPGGNYSIDDGDLLIINPQRMESTFTCEAVNKFGSDKKTFTVSVNYVLTDYGEKKYLFAKEGDTPSEDAKKYICPLPYKTPESVRWFSDGFSINVTGPILKIDKYVDGNHTCRVTDKHSSRSYTFILDIGTPPTFKYQVKYVKWTGSNEAVNCEVNAKPEAEIEWYYNDKKIDEKDKYIATRPVIGWGKYKCRASNVHGSAEKITTVKSRDCLIKRLELTQNAPLTLTRPEEVEDEKNTISWPEYKTDSDYFIIETKKSVTLSCAGDDDKPNYFKKFPGTNEIDVICDHEDNFVLNGTAYKTSDLLCNKKVTPTIIHTGEVCHIEGIDKLRVGFKCSEFIEVYEVCYDSKRALIHSVLSKNGAWNDINKISGYEWYQYPGMSKRLDNKLYNCSDSLTSCCYAKSQLLKTEAEPYSSSAQLSTYIENVNSIPEWQLCDKRNNNWDYVKVQVASAAYDQEFEVVFGASYTSKSEIIPKYLWQLIIANGEMQFALVYVNHPSPMDEDILCSKPCKSVYYDSLHLNLEDKFTYCCNSDEYFEKFTPKPPNGYID